MLLWIPLVSAARPAFFPNAGPQSIPLDADGTVRGHARTGDVLVYADDPSVLSGLPAISEVHVARGGHVARLVLRPGVDDVALSVELRERSDVRWAHPNLQVTLRARERPDDPYLPSQWHLENTGQYGFVPGVDIKAPLAWGITGGAGQLVAILDTGVDIDHPDLVVIDGRDYVDDDSSSDPADDAHGTACAGLAVGTGNNGIGMAGVAYEAQAYGVRLIGATTLQDMYDAFAESVDAGATVLSNSWGFVDDCSTVPLYGIMDAAFEYAETYGRGGLGAAVVFAAGNGACDISNDEMLGAETVIGVSAVSGWDVREWYSSFGAGVDVTAPSGSMYTADLVGAPGYNGYPGDDDYTSGFSGTSAATPVVAGTVALMFAANDRLTAADVRTVLCATAVKVDLLGGAYDESGWSPYYGCGRVNAGAAVLAVANAGPPSAPVATVDEVTPDAAVLTWSDAVDPDGDTLSYTVKWWRTNRVNDTRVETARTFLDLTGEVVDGDMVTFQVRAFDPWGPGEWSEEHTVVVATPPPPPPPPPDTGCTHTSGPPFLWAMWIGLAAAIAAFGRRTPGPDTSQ